MGSLVILEVTALPEKGPFAELWDAIQELSARIDEIELIPGPQGETGPEGPQGETGPQGPEGPAGPSPELITIKGGPCDFPHAGSFEELSYEVTEASIVLILFTVQAEIINGEELWFTLYNQPGSVNLKIARSTASKDTFHIHMTISVSPGSYTVMAFGGCNPPGGGIVAHAEWWELSVLICPASG